jgi:protein STU2
VRLQAYEEMANHFATSPDEGAPCFRPWNNDPTLWEKIVTDSNAVAQEAGLGALCRYVEFGGPNAGIK